MADAEFFYFRDISKPEDILVIDAMPGVYSYPELLARASPQ